MYAALLPIDTRPSTADIGAVKPSKPTTNMSVAVMTADEISPIPVTNTTLVLDAMYQRMSCNGFDDLFDPAVELPPRDAYIAFLEGRVAQYECALEQSEHERVEAERINTALFWLLLVAIGLMLFVGA